MSSRYGSGSGRGRRMDEDELVEKSVTSMIGEAKTGFRAARTSATLPTPVKATTSSVTGFMAGRGANAATAGAKWATATPGRAAFTGGAMGAGLVATGNRRGQGVNKADRYYDPEHRRQRRMGMYEAGAGILGGALLLRGGRGARLATKNTRAVLENMKRADGKNVLVDPRVLSATRRDLGYIGAGTAALGGASVIRHHAESNRGRGWR